LGSLADFHDYGRNALGGDPRRFRLGDEKEGAGAADAVIYQGTMGFE
jgi:hypothetical protein